MTTRWKQKASLALAIAAVLLLFLVIILLWSAVSNDMLTTNSRNKNINIKENHVNYISTSTNNINNNNNNYNKNDDTNSNNININNNNKSFNDYNDKSEKYNKSELNDNNENHNFEILKNSRISQETTDRTHQNINNKINNNLNEEFVKPSKIHHLPLHTEDLLYASERNKTLIGEYYQGYKITGNYRNISSKIWDPHPEYTIKAFGHVLHLILYQDTSFMHSTLKVTHVYENKSDNHHSHNEDHHHLACHYKGHVLNDENSVVSVSLCNGMAGHIRTSFGSYLIQPIDEYTKDDTEMLHKIWKDSGKNNDEFDNIENDNGKKHSSCSIDHHTSDENTLNLADSSTTSYNNDLMMSLSKRSKRSIYYEQQYKLEVLIAVDRQTIEFHGTANIKSYVLTLMGIVSSIFMDASIGNSIHVVVADILLIEDDFNVKSFSGMGVSAAHYLKHFCRFIQKRDYHYDTAVLITRQTICRNETEIVCNTLGLAELGTACKENSCSLVVDNGLTAAFTIAHELGHIFNAPHDDDTKCDRFSKNGKKELNIMASTMGLDIHPWTWSDCSRAYIDDFLEKEDVSCMENDPRSEIKNNNKHFPGELYNLDQQCELIIGPEATFCDVNPDYRTHQNYECRQLYCHDPTTKNFTCRMNGPWADGTPCRDFTFYWCQKGECVPRDNRALKPVEGGWGQWSPYTPCSRSCGGGIQISIRECNSPTPQNGGKYCIGTKKRHLSCNTEECPSHLLDIREQQCFDRNGDNFNIPGLGNDVRWVPKYGVEKRDECKLFCRIEGDDAYFQLAEKVLDGTTCSYESFDKCINGVCHKGGCDNRINSPATLDRCGVCDGRSDTCDEVTKNIYRSDLRKKLFSRNDTLFHHAGIIPKGAANLEIIIKEASRYNKHASYIALFDDHGKNLLNGKKKNKSITISSYKTVFYYDGVTFEYSGSNSLVQRVNTTYSRKLKRDLYIDVIGILNDNDPDDEIIMTYSYTISRMQIQDNNYNYNNIHTTSSSHLYPIGTGSHQNHPTYHHNNNEPSSPPQQEIYKWEVDQWSPCDSMCKGQRSRSIVCIHVDAGHKVASSYCESSKKPDAEIHGYCNTDCELIPNKTSLSECSSSCGSLGTRAIAYQCIQKFINGSHAIVDLVYCYNKYAMKKYEDCREACWSYTEWSPCSQSCGSGQQTRQALCIFDGSKVDESKCNQMKKRHFKEVLRLCNTDPCPAWGRDERTPCSVTCGNGQRTTAIYCMQNNEIVDSNLCSDLPMPKPIILNCSMPSCPTEQTIIRRPTVSRIQPSYSTTYIPSYHVIRAGQQNPSYHPTSEILTNHINSEEEMASWQFGDWGECDDMCERNRTVTCEGAYPRNCPMSTKPLHRKKCCNIKYVARLTPCSAECGNGVRHKEFHCARVYRPEKTGAKRKKIPIDSNYCRNLRKPNSKNFTKPCKMTCGWSYGQWTECPSDCSTDYATRNINCITKDRRQISDKYCDEKRKPTEHKKCLMCNRPARVDYKTSNCTCDGYRRRRVICYDSKDKHIPCTSQYISTKEKCKAPPNCQPRSCQEIRRYQKIYIDGEYTISIKRKPVKIYCHNMSTNRPIEFITLDSLENYSVYYDKRAKYIDKCPDQKLSRDIEEFRDPSISSGSTSFRKIRINLHTMNINTNDYTFANIRGNAQSLGSAGDCYNQNQKCPQGYFSINLSNTGFRIRPTVKWETIGDYTSMEFATKLAYPYQIVRAFCGGYCGHCSISSNTSLILDVI